ncbi:MAG: hypothetical protein KAI66_02640 [Lentisphaeria bacterium]|nr:hypothetical protein [Lentisphaeria bacterium]
MTPDPIRHSRRPPPPPQLSFRIESDVLTWLRENWLSSLKWLLVGARQTIRCVTGILLCAGLHVALSGTEVLGRHCLPILAGLVACFVLTIESLNLVLALVFLLGVAEATMTPSMSLGFLPLLYVVLAFALRCAVDYPQERTPRDTLVVGAAVCTVSSIAGFCHAGYAVSGVLPNPLNLVSLVLVEILLGTLVVTPLLVGGAFVGKRLENAFCEGGIFTFASVAAFFLRRVRQPPRQRCQA